MHTAIALLAAWTAAATDPSAVLERVDAAASRAKDATITLDLTVSAQGAEPLQRTLKIWQQGGERRLVKFTAPAKLRGTGVLTLDGETYVYLPAYEKVRRVVGGSGGGSFLGTGFSVRDLGRTQFSKDYTPSLVSTPEGHLVLKLVPKDPSAHDHAWLVVSVRTSDDLVDRIETVSTDGAITRTLVASDFQTVDGYMVSRSVVIDEVDGHRRTSAHLTDADFDSGLSADAFTERELRRPP